MTPTMRADSLIDAIALYQRLRVVNCALGWDVIEGMVRKRADSIYSVQMSSATEECWGAEQTSVSF